MIALDPNDDLEQLHSDDAVTVADVCVIVRDFLTSCASSVEEVIE